MITSEEFTPRRYLYRTPDKFASFSTSEYPPLSEPHKDDHTLLQPHEPLDLEPKPRHSTTVSKINGGREQVLKEQRDIFDTAFA